MLLFYIYLTVYILSAIAIWYLVRREWIAGGMKPTTIGLYMTLTPILNTIVLVGWTICAIVELMQALDTTAFLYKFFNMKQKP